MTITIKITTTITVDAAGKMTTSVSVSKPAVK